MAQALPLSVCAWGWGGLGWVDLKQATLLNDDVLDLILMLRYEDGLWETAGFQCSSPLFGYAEQILFSCFSLLTWLLIGLLRILTPAL